MRLIKRLKCFIIGHAWIYSGQTRIVNDLYVSELLNRFCTRCGKVECFKFPLPERIDDSTSSADPEQISG